MSLFQLNLSISHLVTGLILIGLSVFVLLKDSKNLVNRLFVAYSISIAWWSITSVFMLNASTEPLATFWDRICIIGAIFIPTTFLHFVVTFLQVDKQKIKTIRFCYLISLFFLLLNFTPLLIKGTAPIYKLNYFTIPGIGYYALLGYIIGSMIYGLYLLRKSITPSTDFHKKQQILYLFYSTILGYLGGLLNFNLVLKLQPYSIIPLGNYLIGIYGIVIAVAIIKYQLLDIRIIFKKSLVYSFSVTLISFLFFVTVLLSENILQNVVGYNTILTTTIAATIIAIIFTPLKNFIQHIIDRVFFKATPIQIAQQNEHLLKEIAQSEKLKAIATLASGMAHEIKNPLTAIKTFTEHLPSKKKDDEFLDKFSKIVGKEVDRVDALVHQLLDFARPAPLSLKNVDIHQLLTETLDFLNNKIIQQHIKLETEFDKNTPLIIQADANQLKQAFLNLLLNAIDAMPESGTLTIGVRVQGLGDRETAKTNKPNSLHPTPYTLNPKIIISIKDTGCGIDKEAQKHIFEPFYSNKDKGTGLGLSITYGIIQEHGGSITLESTPKEGTIFKIYLFNKSNKS